jgi:hypothetical protein
MSASALPEPGEWSIGGDIDEKAAQVLGVSEAEVASLAVSAYQYAWSKVDGAPASSGVRAKAVHDLLGELEYNLLDHLGIEPMDDAD